ncbi:MAG: 2,3-bisphosphoglycerate-dependent phosphoglycerate mutase [Chlamydiae bacterium]|nr:2,3-bisphosphoglycerate-dependent phosphoglycerate mutase [Chlamydiota bacterium]
MGKLILLRHGQSEWNKKNIFTGWIDIPLSTQGIDEALEAGREFASIPIDRIYTSTLIRGTMTAMLAMSVHNSGKVPVIVHEEGKLGEWGKCYDKESEEELIPTIQAWQLNERMYGELQGKNKQKIREIFGDEQVHIWRRSYDIPPPNGESLKMTAERTLPYFDAEILPKVKSGETILVSAHGNSLRSIVMELDALSEEEVLQLEIPTGKPLFYEYRDGKLYPHRKTPFLGV